MWWFYFSMAYSLDFGIRFLISIFGRQGFMNEYLINDIAKQAQVPLKRLLQKILNIDCAFDIGLTLLIAKLLRTGGN